MESTINTSPVKRLSKRSFKAGKSRNMIAVIAIIMTAVMFTTVFTVGFSMVESMAKMGASAGGGMQGVFIAALAVIMILASGYLIIYNIFQISVSQDIRFYGLLKALGATKRQTGRIIVSQAVKLWLIGMPVGLAAGYGIGALVMPVMLVSLGSAASLAVNPLIFLAAALFTLITVLLSCAKPAAAAGKVSPVTAMKYVDSDIDFKAKSKRTSRNFSIRSMASANLKRNAKRTAAVIISIALGFMLMNSLYVMQHSYDKETYVRNFIAADIAVSTGAAEDAAYAARAESGGITPEMMDGMTSLPDVTEWGAVYYTETREKLNEDVVSRMTAYYDEADSGQSWWVGNDEDAARQYADVKKTGEAAVSVYGLDGFTAPMGRVFEGEYDERRFAAGKYVIAFAAADNGEGSVHYEAGDKIRIGGEEYELMAVMEPVQTLKGALHSKDNALEIDYAIHSRAFRQSFPGVDASGLFMNADDGSRNGIAAALEERYPGMTIVTPLSYEARFNAQVMAQVVMGYTLGVVMALIGILNFVNAMLTAIIARKREFAMLESVGMTKPQLKKMLVFEGMNYAVASLALSVALSVFAALTAVQETVSSSWAAAFSFSLAPFAVIIPVMAVLAVWIPLACFRGTQKKSLVERLRETTC